MAISKILKELFKEKPLPPMQKPSLPQKPRPILRPRPTVKHEILFEETKAKPGIPKEDGKKPELPPPPKPPMMGPPKKSFFDKIKGLFRKKPANF